jgi:hypothetical protein
LFARTIAPIVFLQGIFCAERALKEYIIAKITQIKLLNFKLIFMISFSMYKLFIGLRTVFISSFILPLPKSLPRGGGT